MASGRMRELMGAEAGRPVVLQGNIAFATGCARGGIHTADGYPGTPSTEVIDKGLRHLQDHMRVGWSVNEATAVALGFGATMTGDDAVVTLKIPGLFQAADVVATTAAYTAPRGGMVLYIASDFTPSSTQYVTDPRYFLKSCFVPILEPRSHQEMLDIGPVAAALGREVSSTVVVIASGLLCHSEGLVRLGPVRDVPRMETDLPWKRFMNLPRIARKNYETIQSVRMPAVREWAARSGLNRIEWNDRDLGVIVHGVVDLNLREAWEQLPIKPSILSLGMTFPVPGELIDEFIAGITGRVVVLGDGLRFVQEEILVRGVGVEGKVDGDPTTEWSPEDLVRKLGGKRPPAPPVTLAPVPRPPNICAGCPYRAFGLVVKKLKKKKEIVASFGDIGCNTLLFFLDAIDTCTCMGASDAERQGVVLSDPSLAGKVISVLGDSTECHSGLDATRNAIFKNVPGVKVILDNRITAMTGGQPAPSSPSNLAGEENRFNLVKALRGEGARVVTCDGYDMKGIERILRAALKRAEKHADFTVLVITGDCMHQLPSGEKQPRFQIDTEACKQCGRCLVCPGIEADADGNPHYTNLCVGCGGNEGVCVQTCVRDCFSPAAEKPAPKPPLLPDLPKPVRPGQVFDLPDAIRLAVRGVGGQGNLFIGKVLSELALRAGFTNVIKGETHGMAQLGGPVISTFGCGNAHSPVPASASTDVLVVLEWSEVLRPGFLDLLKPEGVVLLNRLRIVPEGVEEEDYPTLGAIRDFLADRTVIEFDALAEARTLGDDVGWSSNAVALGALSTTEPFTRLPLSLWTQALIDLSPTEMVGRGNVASFLRGRETVSKRT